MTETLGQSFARRMEMPRCLRHWLETVSHGVRLCKAVDRPNLSTMFNQYHWMRTERRLGLDATLALFETLAALLHGSGTPGIGLTVGLVLIRLFATSLPVF